MLHPNAVPSPVNSLTSGIKEVKKEASNFPCQKQQQSKDAVKKEGYKSVLVI